MYERKIKNLAQLSINRNIDIDDIAKEINQQKKNDLITEKLNNESKLLQNNLDENEKDINNIEINDISNQLFCKDFYKNLSKFLERKKDSLKLLNILNNNKNIYTNNNTIPNKYKNPNEINNISDNKKNNNTNYSTSKSKSGSKNLGRKRKSK